VASLARPGGNVTGLFLDVPELAGKWIEILREAVPRLIRIAVLWDPSTGRNLVRGAETAAQTMPVQLVLLEARTQADLANAFDGATDQRAGGMLVLSSPVFNSARARIAELAAKRRLPAIMPFPGFVDDGGLVAYGPDVAAMYAQAAEVMVKVLLGARPSVIPVERPARFEFAVNLRTAKSLGVTIPPSLLLRADRVIE
jgi:putative ABC transport system substrate-binding protein